MSDAGATKGPVTRVPCPWCNRDNSFVEHHKQGKLEKRAVFGCEYCGKQSYVYDIRTLPIILLRRYERDLSKDEKMQTFEARKRYCVDVAGNGQACSAAPSSYLRCGVCEQIGELHRIDHCASHRNSALKALQVHIKLEHRCVDPNCSTLQVQYLTCSTGKCRNPNEPGRFRVCHCSAHAAMAKAKLSDHIRNHHG